MSEPHTRNANVSEPHTQNVNVSEPHTRNANVSEPHTRNINVSEPHRGHHTVLALAKPYGVDEEDNHLLWTNLTRTKVSIEAEM